MGDKLEFATSIQMSVNYVKTFIDLLALDHLLQQNAYATVHLGPSKT